MSETSSNLRADLVSPPVQIIEKMHPEFYRISRLPEREAFSNLLKIKPFIQKFDRIQQQLYELIKITYPAQKFTEEALQKAVTEHLDGCAAEEYGVWVYYPWNEKVVHLLDEKEFLALRTNRNLYKITHEERDSLSTKKIGIIGLSVGQSVAMTLTMERSFGELRIADFDTLDLSNMNRIRTGVHNLGIPKTVIVAREIAKIDPFLKVTCFHEGINENNIDDFIHKNGKLDLLIDECDSLDIKILCRLRARSYGIPVLMDTSDRGMIDIERFDLEPERPLFHGIIPEKDFNEKNLQNPDLRVHLSLQIAGAAAISERMKHSIPEIGKTIATWPQLASAVALGGAAVAEISRKVLLGEHIYSGRFYADVEEIIKKDTL